ncbi:MAG TPA: hypothetical protein VKE74_30925 [Gemmataceae bacterium]|nr:hypothetical protein [Gemmataceae bacterium]
MSPAAADRLQGIYPREARSLLQYVREASLYAGPDRDLLAVVNRVADESAADLRTFAEFLEANRIPLPPAGSFPMRYTDLNFVAVRSVLPKLVAELRQQAAALEADLAAITDPGAKAAVQALVDSHRKHLGELESL